MFLTHTIGWWSVLDDADGQSETDYLTSGKRDWDINGDEFFAEKLLGSPAFYSLTVEPDRVDSTKPLIYVSVSRHVRRLGYLIGYSFLCTNIS